jgi:predicted nucleotidyltransferase
MTMFELKKYQRDIEQLCKKYKVNRLYAFGSVLTEEFNKSSDIDLIVDFMPFDLLQYADNYYDFKFSLEDMFHRDVDLLEEKAIKNPYFQQVVNSKRQLVYEH